MRLSQRHTLLDGAWQSYSAAQSTNQNLTTASLVDLTSMTVTVPNPGPAAQWLVYVGLDLTVPDTSTWFLGAVLADGVSLGPTINVNSAALLRASAAKSYLSTGMAAGARIIKVQGMRSTGSGTVTVNSGHSIITVSRVY